MIQFNNLQVLGVRTTKGLLPKLIRFFTNNYINHTANILVVDEKVFAIEMTARGCIQTPIKDYLNGVKQGIYELVILTPDSDVLPMDNIQQREQAWIKYNTDSIGKIPYDFENLLIEQPVKMITNWLGEEIWIGEKGTKSTKKQICQEFSFNAIKNSWADIIKEDGADTNIVDIEQYYCQSGNIITKKDLI